ncbi:MAG TPA: HAD family phosphatase [Thermoleophilaceae bacterium]|nr:HAD family phosphatase [Thermoleophilaceae bacterium]
MKGLLVDFGGVLTSNVFDSFRQFCEAKGIDPNRVKTLFRENPEALGLVRSLEVGDIDEDDFSREFGALLEIDDRDDLVNRMFGYIEPDEAMVRAVKRARGAGVRTGLLSNSMGAGRYDRSAFPDLFDGVVISGEVGLHKPQPEIFELACERVGLAPTDCVFVDDLRENCEGAEAIGITAVLHRGADSTLPELEKLLGVNLR